MQSRMLLVGSWAAANLAGRAALRVAVERLQANSMQSNAYLCQVRHTCSTLMHGHMYACLVPYSIHIVK